MKSSGLEVKKSRRVENNNSRKREGKSKNKKGGRSPEAGVGLKRRCVGGSGTSVLAVRPVPP